MTFAGITGRERSLVVLTAVVIMAVILLTMIIDPQLKVRKSEVAQLRELKLTHAKMTGNVMIRNRIEEAYAKIEPLITGEGNDQQEISAFTRDLSALYAEHAIRTKSMKILATKHEEHYRVLSISVELEGPIGDIVQLISSIETHPKPLRIEQVVLKAKEVVDTVHASFLISKVVTRLENQDDGKT